MVEERKALNTKQRLILAAEKLYAEHGFHAVTLRQITDEAEANVAAVNYHFGSMDKLADAIVTRHISPVNEMRLSELERLKNMYKESSIPVRDLLLAFMQPMMERMKSSQLRSDLFGKIMGQCMGQNGHQLPEQVGMQVKEVVAKFTHEIAATLTHLPKNTVVWRLHYSFGVIAHTLLFSDIVEEMLGCEQQGDTSEEALTRIIDYCVAGLITEETVNDDE